MQKARQKIQQLDKEDEGYLSETQLLLAKNDRIKAGWTILKHRLISRGLMVLLFSGISFGGHYAYPKLKALFGDGRKHTVGELEPYSGNEITRIEQLKMAYYDALVNLETSMRATMMAYRLPKQDSNKLQRPIDWLKNLLGTKQDVSLTNCAIRDNPNVKSQAHESVCFGIDHELNNITFNPLSKIITLSQVPGDKVSTAEISKLYQVAYFASLVTPKNMGSAYKPYKDLLNEYEGRVRIVEFDVESFIFLITLWDILSNGQLIQAANAGKTPEQANQNCMTVISGLLNVNDRQGDMSGLSWLSSLPYYLANNDYDGFEKEVIKQRQERLDEQGWKIIRAKWNEGTKEYTLTELDGTPLNSAKRIEKTEWYYPQIHEILDQEKETLQNLDFAYELNEIDTEGVRKTTYELVKHVEMLTYGLGDELQKMAKHFPEYSNLIDEILLPLAAVKTNALRPDKCFIDLLYRNKPESQADLQKIIDIQEATNFFYVSSNPDKGQATVYNPETKCLIIPNLKYRDTGAVSFDDMDTFDLYLSLAVMTQDFIDRKAYHKAHQGDMDGYFETLPSMHGKYAWYVKATCLLLEVINLRMKNRLYDYAHKSLQPPYDAWIKEFKLKNTVKETRLRQLLRLSQAYFPHRLKTEEQRIEFESKVREILLNLK